MGEGRMGEGENGRLGDDLMTFDVGTQLQFKHTITYSNLDSFCKVRNLKEEY